MSEVDFGKQERDLLLIGCAGVLDMRCECTDPDCQMAQAQQMAALVLAASVLREMEKRQAQREFTAAFKGAFG